MDQFTLIKNHPLFYGIDEDGIKQIFSCFAFRRARFYKDQYIFLEGDPVTYVGVVLSGAVLMEKADEQGNDYFFTEFREGELFGDAFVDLKIRSSTVNYKAISNCTVLLFQYRDTRTYCQKNCRCHLIFTENLMYLLALKTRTFLAKIEILSTRSLRGRILRFLRILEEYPDILGLSATASQQKRLKKKQVFVPLSHTELAEYLGVNRSALVRELQRMQRDQLLIVDQHLYTVSESPQWPSEADYPAPPG